jgi:hypothetical protein
MSFGFGAGAVGAGGLAALPKLCGFFRLTESFNGLSFFFNEK